MSRPLVPELHDALKLTTYGHYDILLKPDKQQALEQLRPYFPATNSWRGVVEHHCHPEEGLWPRSEETFRLLIADGLAAGYSRPDTRGGRSFVVHKLWAPKVASQDRRLTTDADVADLLRFLASDPTWEQFRRRYDPLLASRGEESSPAQNICSLGVHLRLVGMFYRILSSSPGTYAVPADLIRQPFARDDQRVSGLRSQWKLKVVRAHIRFPQRPIRTRDLGILHVIEEKLDEFERVHADNVLYRAGRELLLFYPGDVDPTPDLRALCGLGCWVALESVTADLNVATDTGWLREHLRAAPPVRAHGLPESFPPPICQLCQMAPASKHWPLDYTGGAEDIVAEDLCEDCFSLRKDASPLANLESWSVEPGARVAWVNLRLDFDSVREVLSELYRRYLGTLGLAADQSTSVTMPVVSEFMADYARMRESFGRGLLDSFGNRNAETVSRDLWCLRCDSGQDIFRVLAVLQDVVERFVPEAVKLDRPPLALAVVFALAKFPFFEVLDLLESANDGISIILPGKGTLHVPVKDAGRLVETAREGYRFARGALEKLARVASLSEELARLTANASGGKERDAYERFRPFGIGFKGLLTLARLLEDR